MSAHIGLHALSEPEVGVVSSDINSVEDLGTRHATSPGLGMGSARRTPFVGLNLSILRRTRRYVAWLRVR